jgi:hypothetical protein
VRFLLCFSHASQQVLDTFNNNKARISIQWVIELVTKRGLAVRHDAIFSE